ncbi:hypothetical protein CNMCM5793_000051 [Aspergillus hiratsukae]|uniref:Mitochondrial outer membrane protein OM14 C-terminal domain-containing protein n=1 Tax=Aspergillus hiratsukae TaxID=1194566 RepID=A0A8H6P938_9EURO|nr:hypothetical protein CNMCM5793_000051 [Aspergillus hiratsukae]KAF7160895.1 hypothetical protein CNMCM6106_008269 [Aspergillus hiratsukae]
MGAPCAVPTPAEGVMSYFRAPNPPRTYLSETAESTASLVDVDSPHVVSVDSDFLDKDVKTTTQAERLEREAQEKEERKEQAKMEKAEKAEKAKAKAARAGHAAKRNPVFLGNAVLYALVGAALGYGAYRKHAEGKLSWKLVGTWTGIVGAFSTVDYFVSNTQAVLCYPPRSGHIRSVARNNIGCFTRYGPRTCAPTPDPVPGYKFTAERFFYYSMWLLLMRGELGQIAASLASLSRTIDDYSALSKKELIPEKQEKAFERVKNFRAELADYRTHFDQLRKEREEAQSVTNRNELLGRRPHHAATPENPYAQSSLPQSSPFANPSSSRSGLSFGASPADYNRETHALREQSFFANTNTQLDEFLDRGRAVLADLGQQREVLKGTQRRLYSVANTLGISGDTIRKVERRAKQDKWIFWGGVLVFFLFCWLVVHFLR